MCLIVDTNMVQVVFVGIKAKFRKLNRAVMDGRACLVYGGELTREYQRLASFWRLLVTMDRQGLARQIDNRLVDEETERVRNLRICRSNDCHVVALARVGRVRLIVSNDQKLKQDVRNPKLLSKPRGNIYTEASHQGLLRKHCPQ